MPAILAALLNKNTLMLIAGVILAGAVGLFVIHYDNLKSQVVTQQAAIAKVTQDRETAITQANANAEALETFKRVTAETTALRDKEHQDELTRVAKTSRIIQYIERAPSSGDQVIGATLGNTLTQLRGDAAPNHADRSKGGAARPAGGHVDVPTPP